MDSVSATNTATGVTMSASTTGKGSFTFASKAETVTTQIGQSAIELAFPSQAEGVLRDAQATVNLNHELYKDLPFKTDSSGRSLAYVTMRESTKSSLSPKLSNLVPTVQLGVSVPARSNENGEITFDIQPGMTYYISAQALNEEIKSPETGEAETAVPWWVISVVCIAAVGIAVNKKPRNKV